MNPSQSAACSQASEVLTLALNAQVCELCGLPSRTPSASEFLLSIGPESRAMTMCAPLWPTPDGGAFGIGHKPELFLARQKEVKAKGINGNGMGTPLGVAAQMGPGWQKMVGQRCPCRCHTSMCSAAASPAKTSPTPAPGQDSTGLARVFGQSTPVSLASYDPDTSSWRTSQLSLLGGSEPFSQTWPRSGWIVNGAAYAPPTLERPTAVIASGSLPTPHGMCQEGPRQPGPTGNELGRAVQRRWPTPTKSDGTGGPGCSGRDGGENLRTAAGGSLNPEFVEWLMGFPTGWTEV